MNNKRRLFLKGTLASGAIAVAAASGLLAPRQLLAAWPKNAFTSKSVDDALKNLGIADVITSDQVMLDVPKVAENGAQVKATVETTLKDVKSISILIEKNNQPLAVNTQFISGAQPFLETRVKMSKTSNIIAIVESGGKYYSASHEVKVTVGGC